MGVMRECRAGIPTAAAAAAGAKVGGSPLYVACAPHSLQFHASAWLRKTHGARGGGATSSDFRALVGVLDRYVDAESRAVERRVERDYRCFDPQSEHDVYLLEHGGASGSGSGSGTGSTSGGCGSGNTAAQHFYRTKERRFFERFAPLLATAGFRSVSHDDVTRASFFTSERHRFSVRYFWLDPSLFCRNLSGVAEGWDGPGKTPGVFDDTVAMFVRGDGSVETTGCFYADKASEAARSVSSWMYYQWYRLFPTVAAAIDPEIAQWADAYWQRRLVKRSVGAVTPTTLAHLDIGTQLLLQCRSLRGLLWKVRLEEDTFKDVVVVFRRRRRRRSYESSSDWRVGGGAFNRRNIEIRHYTNVPQCDIKLLLPEKNVRQRPTDYLTLFSSTAVLAWTLGKAAYAGMHLTVAQLALVGVAFGYAMRIVSRWQTSIARYTQIMDTFRDRNQKTTGTGTLQQLYSKANEQVLLQSLLVYFVLLRHAHEGADTAAWSAADLDRHCATELEAASKHGVAAQTHNARVSTLPPRELGRRVVDSGGLARLGLWSHDVRGDALGLRAMPPGIALASLRGRWAHLV